MDDPTVRALSLLGLLESRALWSGEELAQRLGVTVRTVRRDIDRLRRLGYPVTSDRGAEGGYRLGRGARLPPLLLDDAEAVAVVVGLRQSVVGAVEGIADESLRALTKLEQVLPARLVPVVRAIDTATATIDVATGPRVDAEVLTALAAATHEGRRVRFSYPDSNTTSDAGSGGGSERRVEPFRLVTTGYRWYLFCFDEDRADWRTFRLDRITDLHVTTFANRPRVVPDPEERLREWHTRTEPWPVSGTVRISAPVEKVRPRLPERYGSCRPAGEGATEVEAGAPDFETLARHLALIALDLDADLTVVEPVELSTAFSRVAERISGFVTG